MARLSGVSFGARLDSARAKVRRADQHLHALRESLKRFRDRDPNAIEAEERSSPLLVQFAEARVIHRPPGMSPVVEVWADTIARDVVLTPRFAPPILRWGTMIGDIAHNLASALDNLVYELGHVKCQHELYKTVAWVRGLWPA